MTNRAIDLMNRRNLLLLIGFILVASGPLGYRYVYDNAESTYHDEYDSCSELSILTREGEECRQKAVDNRKDSLSFAKNLRGFLFFAAVGVFIWSLWVNAKFVGQLRYDTSQMDLLLNPPANEDKP